MEKCLYSAVQASAWWPGSFVFTNVFSEIQNQKLFFLVVWMSLITCCYFWNFCFSSLKYFTIRTLQIGNHWCLSVNGAFETLKWNFLVCVRSCSWVCSVCTVLYVFTECVRVSRVACVCVMVGWLSQAHELAVIHAGAYWMFTHGTVCVRAVSVSVTVCLFAMTHHVFFFPPEKKGCKLRGVPHRACGSMSDLEDITDLWRSTVRTFFVCVLVCRITDWPYQLMYWLITYPDPHRQEGDVME